jgi:Multidrug resistance efflux pump
MRIAARFAAWVAGMVLIFGGFALVSGDEPKGQETKCTDKTCQEKQCQYHSTGVPILSKIPYVSRLFKTVGIVDEPSCEAGQCMKTPCAEEFERIGIDFECPTCPNCPVVRFGPIELAICGENEACACPSAGKVGVGKVAVACAAKCCEEKCGEGKCCCGEGKCCCGQCQCAAAIAAHIAHKSTACQCAGREELWEHLIELSAEKAAAEAALEAREEHSELLDALVEMATKSAALEARLEAQAEHHHVLERMVELAVENAQLKARAELAEAKTEMLKESLPVAVEKELLARRVAELEERLAASEAGLRTAKKANSKKAR